MQIDDLDLYNFKPDVQEGDEIQCPECEEWTPHTEWTEGEVGCEDCGEHMALICPKCEARNDHVYSEFNTRHRQE